MKKFGNREVTVCKEIMRGKAAFPEAKIDDKPEVVPRDYQLYFLNYVKDNNAIIYLPTGMGKTLIAIMAIKQMRPHIVRPIHEGGKRAIFMCNTVELAHQQYIALKEQTNFWVGYYVGERDSKYWTRKKWRDELAQHQVLVGTAQVFVDLVSKNKLRIFDLCIVIIDECHHATKKHPMHEFLRSFTYVKDQSKLPRVVGLTGVLINGNKISNIEQDLTNLEACFRGHIITAEDLYSYENVMLYGTKPVEQVLYYIPLGYKKRVEVQVENDFDEIIMRIVDILDCEPSVIKLSKNLCSFRDTPKKYYVKYLLNDMMFQLEDYGLYVGGIAVKFIFEELFMKARHADAWKERQFYQTCFTWCSKIMNIIDDKISGYRVPNEMDGKVSNNEHAIKVGRILRYSTAKLRSLLWYIVDMFDGKQPNEICSLIFVERRYTAKCISAVIKEFSACFEMNLFPEYMVGRNVNGENMDISTDRSSNKLTMDKFHSGECNMIVCSSVLEEGIDVQACNYVLMLDTVKTFTSYIQSRGRARSSGSIYLLFIDKNLYASYVAQLHKYQEAHKVIKDYLSKRSLNRALPTAKEICEQFPEEIEPFKTSGGAYLSTSNALSILHSYCSSLPTDSNNRAAPLFELSHDRQMGQMQVTLKLPMHSRIKEPIKSEWVDSCKMAKVDAAFKACKLLYENKELDERLTIVSRQECLNKCNKLFFQHWMAYDDSVLERQCRAMSRVYDDVYPEHMVGGVPAINENYIIYEFIFDACFPQENHYNEHILNIIQQGRDANYGIMVRKSMPAIATMPLYLNQGTLKLHVETNAPIIARLKSKEQLESLYRFHVMIFRDVVKVWKSCYVLDRSNKENSYLIVPLKRRQIDWDLVRAFPRISRPRAYSIKEREMAVYKPEQYLGKMVARWFGNFPKDACIVTKIHKNLTMASNFPNKKFGTYKNFFEHNYGVKIGKIVRPEQFLMELRPLTKRTNFINNGLGKNNVIDREQLKINVPPELCHNYEFPANMWFKAIFLPSILHRLKYLLHADWLRQKVNSFLGINEPMQYRPEPIKVDQSLKRAVGKLPNLYEINRLEADWKRTGSEKLPNKFNELDEDLATANIAEQTETPNLYSSMKKEFETQFVKIRGMSCYQKRFLKILERKTTNIEQGAEQRDFAAALTTASTGDVFDMERYELLGDSFLKLAVALYLVNKFPHWNEGHLSEIKSKLVSNRNLLYLMLDHGWHKYICAEQFMPHLSWLPPLATLPNALIKELQNDQLLLYNTKMNHLNTTNLTESEVMDDSEVLFTRILQTLLDAHVDSTKSRPCYDKPIYTLFHKKLFSDKVVADTLEAILGVCVHRYGLNRTFRMLEFFKICKGEKDMPLTNLLDLKLSSPLLRTNIPPHEVDSFLKNYWDLENILGYKFKDRAFLLQALTHPSYPTNRLTGCYEELEFIGDAILDFLIATYLFERYDFMTPGMLTDLRSALVNNKTLAVACVRNQLHEFMLYENVKIYHSIRKFVNFQLRNGHSVQAVDVDILNQDIYTPYDSKLKIGTAIMVPKTLGDLVEAIIAAVYLDSRCLITTWNIIYNLMEKEITLFSERFPLNSVRQLFEICEKSPIFADPVYEQQVVSVKCSFYNGNTRTQVHGFGVNAKTAKKVAARCALNVIEQGTLHTKDANSAERRRRIDM